MQIYDLFQLAAGGLLRPVPVENTAVDFRHRIQLYESKSVPEICTEDVWTGSYRMTTGEWPVAVIEFPLQERTRVSKSINSRSLG